MWQCKGKPQFFNKAKVNKSSKYLFWHIFIYFLVCLLPAVCGEKSVSSFSNYYTKFLKNGADLRTEYGPTFPASAPVSIPENVLADYSSYPYFQQQIRIQKRKEEPASTEEHKDHSNEIKNEHHGWGWGWGEHKKEPEKDNTLDEFTGYLGPFLFLVPFVLKLVPFAIPALPLSYILTRYEPGNVTEIITRVTEFATQITELIQQTAEG